MSSNLRQPSRIAAYTAEGSYYPRELVEVNGELYLINADGTRTRVNPAETTTLTDSSGTVIGSIDPTAEDTIELPSASATQSGFVKFSTTAPKANGTAAVGTATTAARSDHVHPAQTTISGNAATATKLKSGNTIALSGGATGTATNFDGSAPITIPVTALDATKLTGVIPLACIPKGAQERLVVTSTDTTRLALTISDVQNGDVVKVESTGLMYYVADETALGTEAAFEAFTAGAASSVAWANVTDKPAFATVATSGNYSDLSGLPTIPVATSTAALAAGTAAAGSSADFARADHVHPKQTSVSGNAGTATKLAAGVNIGLSGVTATAQEFDGSTAITIPITEVPVRLVTGLAAIATSGKYSDLSGAPSIPAAATATPKVASGSGAVGTDTTWARADHVHPVQTTISGNAATATKLATGVNIGLSGVTATAQKFDGSTAITIPVTAVPASIVTGTLGLSHGGTGATTDREAEYKINANIPESEVAISDTSKLVFKLSSPSATAGTFVYKEASTLSDYLAGTAAPKALGSSASAGTSDKFARIDHVHPAQTTITGNAETATKLASPVNISLSGVTATAQEFDGTSDISIPVTAVPASIVTGLADVSKSGSYNDLLNTPSIPEASTTTPKALGTAAVGSANTWARADHVHPVPTTVSGNAGSATKLATTHTIGLSGVTATSQEFDGTQDVTIPITAVPASIVTDLADVAKSGSYNDLEDTPSIPVASSTAAKPSGTAAAGSSADFARADHVHPAQTDIAGNAASATKLKTGNTIALSDGATGTATNFDGSAPVIIPVTALDATKLTGIIPISCIPQGALERLIIVSDDNARLALNSSNAQAGDVVKVEDSGLMYYIKDDSLLGTEAAFEAFTAGTASAVAWSNVTGKPTFATVATSGKYSDLSGTPSIPSAATTVPSALGTAAAGSSADFARADHVHPAQTDIAGNAASATKVSSNLTIKLNNGNTENTNLFTFDGSSAKNVNITPASIGAATTDVVTTSSNGLMGSSDKIYLENTKVVDFGNAVNLTVPDLREMLYEWITTRTTESIFGSKARIAMSSKFIELWNNDDNTTIIGSGGAYCFEILSYYYNCTAGFIRITHPSSLSVYYVTVDENGTWGNIHSNALTTSTVEKAKQLNSTRYFKISGAAVSPSVGFDGSAGVTFDVGELKESYIRWGGKNIVGDVSPIDAALYSEFSANRLEFMDINDIGVEYSTDGGNTWVDYEAQDYQKTILTSTIKTTNLYIGKKDGSGEAVTTNDKIRITITATSGKLYFAAKKAYIYINSAGSSGCNVSIDGSKCGSENEFVDIGTYEVKGWPGWNSIPLSIILGGSDSQTNQYRKIRFTFGIESLGSGYKNNFTINKIRMAGPTCWASPSDIANNGHLYKYDHNKNATFPANLSAKSLDEDGVSLSSKYAGINHGTHVVWSTTTPKANGTAAIGSETKVARGDHVHPLQTTISGNAGSADKVNKNLIISLNGGETEGTDLFTFNGSSDKTIDITPSAIGASASGHTHNYAGSSSAGGAATSANKVNTNLVVKLNSGTTEGTDLFTFNGSATKTIDITPAAIGAAEASHGTHVSFTTTAPNAAGTAAVGSATTVSRSDHVHPAQTTISGNAGSADKVNNSLSIQLNSGTATVFDGSAIKTINITASSVGASESDHTHNYAGSSSAGGAATSANKVNTNLTIKLNGGATEGTDLFTFNGSAAKTINITPDAIGAAAASHGTHLSLGETSSTAYRGDRGATAYTHSQAAHAPSNAQKNSDITKAEIEAKLTGTITSHNHSGTYADASHGNHVPDTQTASNSVFLRNDNTWATVTPANIGAAEASHGTHVSFTATTPKANGTAATGSATTVSRSDHVHPKQTISRTYTASIGTTWTGSAAPYTQTISVSGMTASDNPIVDVVLSGTYSTDETALVEYAKIYRITTAANSITVYASEKTESAVSIQLKCVNS